MKICFRCNQKLDISFFYRHSQMKDGVLGKCKECAKKDVRKNYRENIDHYQTYENERKKTDRRRAYYCWNSMMDRCYDKNSANYIGYGGRGISVSKSWLNFEHFYADMKNRPRNTSIDRIDNNGNYSKENCRWATVKEQNNNRRDNVILEFNGEKNTLANLCTKYGLKYKRVWMRLKKGWTIEKSFNPRSFSNVR